MRLWDNRVGANHGCDDVFVGDCPETRSYDWAAKRAAIHVVVYSLSMDAGPDEANLGERVSLEISSDVFTWVFRQYCFLHQIHLMILMQLTRLDMYWSGLATCVNVWRSPH